MKFLIVLFALVVVASCGKTPEKTRKFEKLPKNENGFRISEVTRGYEEGGRNIPGSDIGGKIICKKTLAPTDTIINYDFKDGKLEDVIKANSRRLNKGCSNPDGVGGSG